MRPQGTARALGAAALAHAAVDVACAVMLVGATADGRLGSGAVATAFLAYGLLAFGTQPIIGVLADRHRAYALAAVSGLLVVAVALLVARVPGGIAPAIVLAGLGNAVFHVGGGAFSLRATPGKALAPGLFVAPGAAGLAVGSALGRAEAGTWPVLAVLLGTALVLGHALRDPSARAALAHPAPDRHTPQEGSALGASLLLVLTVVAVRSLVGTAVSFPWASVPAMAISVTAMVVTGKAAGGLFADRLGRVPVGVVTLMIASVCLVAGGTLPAAGLLGLFAFNVTMPITLVALGDALPRYPGTAFGLACVALIAGAYPKLLGVPVASLPAWAMAVLVIGSAAALAYALTRLGQGPQSLDVHHDLVTEGSAL